jgi:hypothetical protein
MILHRDEEFKKQLALIGIIHLDSKLINGNIPGGDCKISGSISVSSPYPQVNLRKVFLLCGLLANCLSFEALNHHLG